MPNPTITPWNAATTTYTVMGSTFAAVDIRLGDLDNAPASIILTAPAGATVHAVRNPGAWNAAETALLTGGAWTGGAILLGGEWNLVVTPGGAPTDPATVTLDDPDGSAPTGTLRLLFRNLGGANAVIEKAGGTQSIDRVLANPSILNAQVTSPLPVYELAPGVTLNAIVQATQSSNPMPAQPLSALPPIVAAWREDPANPATVSNFVPAGTSATFKAPAAYTNIVLNFTMTGAYDLDGAGLLSATNPSNQLILPVTVNTVAHGMVLVLDRSGSMGGNFGGGSTRWAAAVRAAHAWLDLYRALRPGNPHKAGIVTFEHDNCSWTPAPSADDITLRDPATGLQTANMAALSGFGNQASLNLGAVQSCTPIGDGLMAAWQAINLALSGGSGGKKGSVLLLTDGYENAGTVTIAATQGSASSTFATSRTTVPVANTLIGPDLFTVAVGQQVDQARLNNLGLVYNMSNDVNEVLQHFVQMVGQVFDAQQSIPLGGSPANTLDFPVSAGEQRVAFLVPWNNVTDDLSVGWRLQSGGGFTQVNPMTPGVEYYRRQGHGLMVVPISITNQTAATVWRVQHKSGGVDQPLPVDGMGVPTTMICVVDLLLKAEVGFDQPQYFVGDTIRLRCRITRAGVPVTGAAVEMDVSRPGEGLGTFLAINAARYKSAAHGTQATQAPDPPKGKGHMHATLLQLHGLDDLPLVQPPAFVLKDDGAHGDGAANDGFYSGTFTDTVKEGTYTFRFRIQGMLPDGSRFSRLFVRSTWVGVRPHPSKTTVVWAAAQVVDGALTQVVTFTPRAKNGEYLGPFQHDAIHMTVFDGTFDGDLHDNLDGSYSRKVRYREGDRPIVSIEVNGVSITPSGPFTAADADQRNCWRLWLAAIRCTIRSILRFLRLKP